MSLSGREMNLQRFHHSGAGGLGGLGQAIQINVQFGFHAGLEYPYSLDSGTGSAVWQAVQHLDRREMNEQRQTGTFVYHSEPSQAG